MSGKPRLDSVHAPRLGAPASLPASLRLDADFAGKDAGAPRFMAPIHVQSLEVLPFHQPGWGETPSNLDFPDRKDSRARRSLAPPFERARFARRPLGWLTGMLVLGLVLGPGTVFSADPAPGRGAEGEDCRIGFSGRMFTEINENDAKASIKVWAQVLFSERNIPVNPDPKVIHGVSGIIEAVRAKQVDCIAIPIDEYAAVAREVPLGRLIVSLKDGRATEEYVLLVRQDGGIEKIEQLRQRSLAVFQSPRTSLAESWLGAMLAEKGLGRPEKFCGAMTRFPKLQRVVLPVFFRQVDACLVTRRGFETMSELNPQIGRQLKILATSPEVVPVGFWFRRDYAPPFFERLVSELTRIHTTPAGQQVLTIFQCDRLEEFQPSGLQGSLDLLALAGGSAAASNAAAQNSPNLDGGTSGGGGAGK